MKALVPMEVIEQKILLIQGEKVLLDKDLAALYGVTTNNLNKAVNRNIERFPKDFMIHLTTQEFCGLEVPFWNIKLGRNEKTATGFYGARCGHAFERPAKQTGDRSEHYDNADLRQAQKDDRHSQGPGAEARGAGKEV